MITPKSITLKFEGDDVIEIPWVEFVWLIKTDATLFTEKQFNDFHKKYKKKEESKDESS